MWLPALLVYIAVCSWACLRVLVYACRWRTRRRYGVAPGSTTVGFFHPFCAGGGGGERVLWRAVHTLSRLSDDIGTPLHVLIYTGDVDIKPEDILSRVARHFDISVDPAALPVSFVYLRRRRLLDASLYPVFTMLAQSLASMVLAAEALCRGTPDLFIDTTGFAFSFPVAWLAGCSVAAYVHYPTISSDMLSRVRDRRPSHNNSAWIASSVAVSWGKLLYYRAFACMYGVAGGFFASRVLVNSSWTKGHIAALWRHSRPPTIVFPPCDTSELENLPINSEGRERYALSVGQFRPEKNHGLQVWALAALRTIGRVRGGESPCFDDVRLVILGGCRNDGDRAVLERTRSLAVDLGVSDRVEFVVNCSFDELKAWLGRASVGLHTMWNEHFGIGVVEMMAAGVVTIAHRSGGPAADIVVPLPDGRITGFLAETPQEYAEAMATVFSENGRMQSTAARSSSRTGGDQVPEGEGGEANQGKGLVFQQQGEGGGSNNARDSGGNAERQKQAGEGGGEEGEDEVGRQEERRGRVFFSEAVRLAGRESARRFSNQVFDRAFAAEFVELLKNVRPGLSAFAPGSSSRTKQD
ncbi:GT4 [Ectocarpus sp. CCAP 1310/34]|nr:GT4 [Ectocarpus sp. CCAP 1310/34]